MRWNIPAPPQPHLLVFGCCFLKPASPWDEAAHLDRGRSLWVRAEKGCKWDRLLLKAAHHRLPAQQGIDFSLHIYSWRLRHSRDSSACMPTAAPSHPASNRWAQRAAPSLLLLRCQRRPLAKRDSRSGHSGFSLDTTASLPPASHGAAAARWDGDTRIHPGIPTAPHGKGGPLVLSRGLGVPIPPSRPRRVLVSGSSQREPPGGAFRPRRPPPPPGLSQCRRCSSEHPCVPRASWCCWSTPARLVLPSSLMLLAHPSAPVPHGVSSAPTSPSTARCFWCSQGSQSSCSMLMFPGFPRFPAFPLLPVLPVHFAAPGFLCAPATPPCSRSSLYSCCSQHSPELLVLLECSQDSQVLPEHPKVPKIPGSSRRS